MRFKRDLIRMLMFITCVNMSTATTNSNLKMTARFADHRAAIIMNFNCTQTLAQPTGSANLYDNPVSFGSDERTEFNGEATEKKGLNFKCVLTSF